MRPGEGDGAAQEQVQVKQVGDLIWGHQRIRCATSACSRHTACGGGEGRVSAEAPQLPEG